MIKRIHRKSTHKKNEMVCRVSISISLLGAAFSMQCAFAQTDEAGGGETKSLVIEPRVSITGTYSNNIDLSNRNPKADFLTEISPGFRVSSDRGRFRGTVDYSLNQLLYQKYSDKNELQNSLNAAGVAELVDNWAYIDVFGTISQQYLSAFGTPSVGSSNINDNKTEVSNFKFSPYVKGEFGSFAAYEVRYTSSVIKTKSDAASDITSDEGSIRLSSREMFNRLRWSADLTKSVVDYNPGRKTTSDVGRVTLQYPVGSQFYLVAIGGREANNFVTVEKESEYFSGGGFTWNPGVTTSLAANTEHHTYGNTHNVSFQHRTPRTAWSISDTRSVSMTPILQGVSSLGTIYDLLFSQFSAIEQDPVKRAKIVNSYLAGNGINPGTEITGGYSTSGLSMQRNQTISFALLGIRDTITFTGIRSEGQSLSTNTGLAGNFSDSQLIRQNGLIVNYSHKLTPNSVISFLLSQQSSEGDTEALKVKLRSLGVNFSTQLSQNIFSTLGFRRVISSGDATSYQETAVTGGLNIRF